MVLGNLVWRHIFDWSQVHYDRYNKRFGKDGFHETLSWTDEAQAVEDFKEKFIYPEMIEGEVKVIKCLNLSVVSDR